MKRDKRNSDGTTEHYTPTAVLAAIGAAIQHKKLLEPIRKEVHIRQKHCKFSPYEKLVDALIAILSGCHGMVEVDTRVRPHKGLQKAFGRNGCADQSGIQKTLSCCTPQNVEQLQAANDKIFRAHSRSYKHNFDKSLLLIDIDATGLPCGKKQEGSTKGYQGIRGIRYGRQLCRAIASQYEEIIYDQLDDGNVYLVHTLYPVVEKLEQILGLTPEKKARTVIRMDAGGGSYRQVQWLLNRGYQVHIKEGSARRAEHFSHGVKEWVADPKHPGREIGWLAVHMQDFDRSVQRLIIRWHEDKSSKLHYASIITTLESCDVIDLLNSSPGSKVKYAPAETLSYGAPVLAYSKLYDLRGGTVEIEIKESKQGIGITKRSKKKIDAQKMVIILNTLAHNILVWARRWLTETKSKKKPKYARYGALRFVRDIFHTSGKLQFDVLGELSAIILNRFAPFAEDLVRSLNKILRMSGVEIKLE